MTIGLTGERPAAAHAHKVIADLQQQIATLNASSGDLAAAEALKKLGENASAADKEMVTLLAPQLADGREAKNIRCPRAPHRPQVRVIGSDDTVGRIDLFSFAKQG